MEMKSEGIQVFRAVLGIHFPDKPFGPEGGHKLGEAAFISE
jgi:hypothetical protein